MDREEIEIMERLKAELSGVVNKPTAKDAMKVYNKYNEEKINNCMCSRITRKSWGNHIIEWYERQDR